MVLFNTREGQIDTDMAWYVFRYYPQLMHEHERAANRHRTETIKATKGRSDAEAQAKARSGPRPLQDLLSDEPPVLCLAADGYQAFLKQTAERIVKDPSDKIELHCCPPVRQDCPNTTST